MDVHARRVREVREILSVATAARTLFGSVIDRVLNPERTLERKLARLNLNYVDRNRQRRGIQGSRETKRA